MRIMFFSPHALADSSSGAARSVHTLLEELEKQGHSCRVVTGTVVDGKNQLFAKIALPSSAAEQSAGPGSERIPVRQFKLEGVPHVMVGARPVRTNQLRSLDEVALHRIFLAAFQQFQPDVVLTYGGFASNVAVGYHAKAQGRTSVLYAASDTYRAASDFDHLTHVVTVSRALQEKLQRVTRLPVTSLSSLVRTGDVVSQNRKPEYITFINPVPAKGLKLAVALAAECHRLQRPYKFLFVESRGTAAEAVKAHPELAPCANVIYARNTLDMRAIYARTKILIYPSVWFEAAGRALVEANANGIPVLATRIGGIPETVDGAGYLFDPVPEAVPLLADYVAQWLARLDQLHNDPAELADAERRAKDADGRYDLAALARKFIQALG